MYLGSVHGRFVVDTAKQISAFRFRMYKIVKRDLFGAFKISADVQKSNLSFLEPIVRWLSDCEVHAM